MGPMFASESFLTVVQIYLFVFGALTLAGGVMGFVKAKSRASLIAGTLFGGLLIASGYFTGRPFHQSLGTHNAIRTGLVVSLVLGARFVGVFRKSSKTMPALPMIILSGIGAALTLAALLATSATHS